MQHLNGNKACDIFTLLMVLIFFDLRSCEIMFCERAAKVVPEWAFPGYHFKKQTNTHSRKGAGKHNKHDRKINFIYWQGDVAPEITDMLLKASRLYIIRRRTINLTLHILPLQHQSPVVLVVAAWWTAVLHDLPDRQTDRRKAGWTRIDLKMALSVISPVQMTQAAYEEALLDIGGDKNVRRNEPFLTRQSDPGATAGDLQIVSLFLVKLPFKSGLWKMILYVWNLGNGAMHEYQTTHFGTPPNLHLTKLQFFRKAIKFTIELQQTSN